MSDMKVSIEAKRPFEFGVMEPMSPYWSEWCEYVRTRFEHRDPELLAIIANIYRITVIRIPMWKVREYFAYRNALTKHEIALHIAKIIPAFSYQVGPFRTDS